jgi:hypothetical protein
MTKFCPACGKENAADEQYCIRCGRIFVLDAKQATQPEVPSPIPSNETQAVSIASGSFNAGLPSQPNSPHPTVSVTVDDHPHSVPAGGHQRITHLEHLDASNMALYVDKSDRPIIIKISERVSLGRAAGSQSLHPTVDLTDYGAYEKGVSRVHVIIRRVENGLTIEDQGSSNGSWLNGSRLKPYVPVALTPGDRIDLSQLPVEIYFLANVAPTGQTGEFGQDPEKLSVHEGKHDVHEQSLDAQREGQDQKPTAADSTTATGAGAIASRFQGKYVLDNDHFDEQLHIVVRDIVDQLRGVKGCEVNVSIEVNARSEEPIDPEIRKSVYEASSRLNTLTSEFRTT